MTLTLHGYWRSTASYRVRIALNLKEIVYDQVTHDLRTGAQRDPAYLALTPQGLVPALEAPDGLLTQSLALIEWIDEHWPQPALLPKDARGRAIVRGMVDVVGADIHPLNNLRVLQALREQFAATPDQVQAWIARWITDGFTALEHMISVHSGVFAFGDQRPWLTASWSRSSIPLSASASIWSHSTTFAASLLRRLPWKRWRQPIRRDSLTPTRDERTSARFKPRRQTRRRSDRSL